MMPATPDIQRDASCDHAGDNSPTLSDTDETEEEGFPSKGRSRHHPRQLTAAGALEIFRLRPLFKGLGQIRRGTMAHCKAVAPQFGVSAKTVREIWAGRAWKSATRQEWTEAEIATRASSFSLMRHDPAGAASISSDTTAVLQATTNNDAVADSPPHSWSIPALQHSLPRALGPVAPPSQQQAPTHHLLGLNNGAVASLHSLLAAAHAPQQPAGPPAHASSIAQILAPFSGFQTAPPQTTWGSGAATPLVTAQDLESTIRFLQATLLQQEVQLFLQQHQHHLQ
ncbi:hypothetical protein T484DRAFT_1989293 [Baffinella frigidus]|nr:hypothetical protein T484DRAFT_1989293 [Cryptophyta sp. CCMP2293]